MFGKSKKIKEYMEPFIKHYSDAKVTFPKKKFYDCEIEYNNKLYLLTFFKIPKGCRITVNNRYIWQILNGKSGLVTVKGVEKFIDGKDNRKHIKVAVLVNNTLPVRRWINECDMEFVDVYSNIYGSRMVELEKLINQIDALKEIDDIFEKK